MQKIAPFAAGRRKRREEGKEATKDGRTRRFFTDATGASQMLSRITPPSFVEAGEYFSLLAILLLI